MSIWASGKGGDWISAFAGDMWSLFKQNEDQNFQHDRSEAGYAFQDKMAQNAVQYRVADAIKAGVHPLYAIGGAFSPGQPIPVMNSDAPLGAGARSLVGTHGQKDAGRVEMTPEQRQEYELRMENLRSQTEVNYAERIRLESEAMKNYQDGVGRSPSLLSGDGSGSSGVVVSENQQFAPGNRAAIEMKAPQRYSESGEAGVASGQMTGTERVRIPSPVNPRDSIEVIMPFSPGQGPWEAWGELDYPTKLLFMRLNMLRDPQAAGRFWNEVVMGRRMPPADRSGEVLYRSEAFRKRNRWMNTR